MINDKLRTLLAVQSISKSPTVIGSTFPQYKISSNLWIMSHKIWFCVGSAEAVCVPNFYEELVIFSLQKLLKCDSGHLLLV
jgi:hypothetical protein